MDWRQHLFRSIRTFKQITAIIRIWKVLPIFFLSQDLIICQLPWENYKGYAVRWINFLSIHKRHWHSSNPWDTWSSISFLSTETNLLFKMGRTPSKFTSKVKILRTWVVNQNEHFSVHSDLRCINLWVKTEVKKLDDFLHCIDDIHEQTLYISPIIS